MLALVLAGLGCIIFRLWYLQIAKGEEMWTASEINRTRQIRRVPPRGQIEDRNGVVLATNRNQIVVSVVPEEMRKNPGTLPKLAKLLNKSTEELEWAIESGKTTMFDPVRVEVGVEMDVATQIEEQHSELPGVSVGPEPIRKYVDGPVFGHLLGQLGQIKPDDLKKRRDVGYKPGDFCGQLGVERANDDVLRGYDGGREVEVNAKGRIIKDVGNIDPVPGATVRLTIDAAVQKVAYEALAGWVAKGKPGAAVAIDPQTGAVIALASCPSYDPNQFVTGISRADWKKLSEDPLKPQINRAISGGYAPGSTFKVITASAGLETHSIGVHDSEYCTGGMYLGRWLKRCHKSGGHGSVDMVEALQKSCDVYFYRLGQKLGPDNMAAYARKFGLGTRTKIDIMGENDPQIETSGLVPDPEWKRKHKRGEWVGGETVDYAIGQAMLKCTPLQMCNVAAAIGNGGTLYRPQLVQRVTAFKDGRPTVARTLQPQILNKVDISEHTRSIIVEGMRAVMGPGGTAARSVIPGLEMAGKTGTAQMRKDGRMVNNAWFIGYAPADHPKIAVCVFVETGGHGGDTAAPIASKMIGTYLHMGAVNADATGSSD